MSGILKSIGLLSTALTLLACAGAGKDFVRPSTDSFKLGQTTYSQVIQQMGEPKTTGESLHNDKTVKHVIYSYANVSGEPLEQGVNSYRGLTFFFYNDTLVGKQFISSFKVDNSNFDETKIGRIEKGRTTRTEVIELMGVPTASFIPPMVKEPAVEAIGYTYQAIRGGLFSGLKPNMKSLRISLDGNGVVSDLDYTTSGNK